MAFTVEDGNGLPEANAYIDVAFADSYFTDRGNTDWAAASSDQKQVAIVKATDYIDKVNSNRFLGYPAFRTNPPNEATDQALEFPRTMSVPFIGDPSYYLDVVYIPNSSVVYPAPPEKPVAIPRTLKKACAEYALRALLNGKLLSDPVVDETGVQLQSKTENVGPIQTSYVYYNTGGISVTQPYPEADLLLKPLLRPGGVVIRG
jgi:hypothetical protein